MAYTFTFMGILACKFLLMSLLVCTIYFFFKSQMILSCPKVLRYGCYFCVLFLKGVLRYKLQTVTFTLYMRTLCHFPKFLELYSHSTMQF